MISKISISNAERFKSAPQLPKTPPSYFISTRNLCKIDDLLAIGVGGMALKTTRTANAGIGAFLGALSLEKCGRPAVKQNEESERFGRFLSIGCSLAMAVTFALKDDKDSWIPGFKPAYAGYRMIHALASQYRHREEILSHKALG